MKISVHLSMAPQGTARHHWIDQLDPALASSIRFYAQPANLSVRGSGKVSRWVLAGVTTPADLTRLAKQQQLRPSQENLRAANFQLPGLQLLALTPGTPSQFAALQKQARSNGFELWQEIAPQISFDSPIDVGTITEPVFNAATAPDYDGDGSADTTWHLQASVAPTATATGNYGINAVGAWSQAGGDGVYLGITDSQMDLSHPDLQAALPTRFDWDGDGLDDAGDADGDGIPDVFLSAGITWAAGFSGWQANGGTGGQSHGTASAGLALARLDGAGAVGVAPQAFWVPSATSSAFNRPDTYFNLIDISSNSWGSGADRSSRNEGTLRTLSPTNLANWQSEIAKSIVVKSAGNERSLRTSSGFFGWDNFNNDAQADRHVIAVAATMMNGNVEPYSTPGANVFVAAPVNGSNSRTTLNTITSDVSDLAGNARDNRGYVDGNVDWGFNGTSAATPMVAGTIALMLEVNPNLTVRDVQHIFVETAQKNRLIDSDQDGVLDASSGGTVELRTTFLPGVTTATAATNEGHNTGWFRNGAGHWVSDSFGFGIVDAGAAVDLARTWTPVSPELRVSTTTNLVNQPAVIPEGNLGGLTSLRELTSWQSNSSLSLEWVELNLNLSTTEQDELMLVLVSPSGTRSVLMAPGGSDAVSFNGQRVFRTNQFWGESALGEWRLEALDISSERIPDSQTVSNASLDLYGTCQGESPLQVVTYADIKAANGTLEALANQLLRSGGAPAGSYRLEAVRQIGTDDAFGQFSSGTASQLQVDQGLIFTTGKAKDAIGPNDQTDTSTNQSSIGHALHGAGMLDSSGMEIRFTPTRDISVQWKAQFGSEEFQEYSPSQYNDRASLFLAMLKTPSEQLTPESGVIDLLQGPNGTGYSVNDLSTSPAVWAKYAVDNPICGPMAWEYDGGTNVPSETRQVLLKANRTYVLAPIVSDATDAFYDSGLILGRADSVAPKPKLRFSTAKAFEGDVLTFAADQLKPNTSYQWKMSGRGLTGKDLQLTSLSGTLKSDAAGRIQQEFFPSADALGEASEQITLQLFSGSSRIGTPITALILDSPLL